MEFRVFAGKGNELIDVRSDGLYSALHRGDGVALALQAYALSELGTEYLQRDVSSTAAVHAGKVASKNKDLIVAELRNVLRGDTVSHRKMGLRMNDGGLRMDNEGIGGCAFGAALRCGLTEA